MKKLSAVIHKEFLLLLRDRSSLAIIFLMPLALVIVMTLIQDVTFRKISEKVIPVVVINNDTGGFGKTLIEGLQESGNFEIIERVDNREVDESTMNKLIIEGKFQVGLIIPSDASKVLEEQTIELNKSIFSGLPADVMKENFSSLKLVFDPVIQDAVRLIIQNTLENLITKAQAKTVFKTISVQVNPMRANDIGQAFDRFKPVQIEESYATKGDHFVVPDSVQHNIPGWTIFAIFFIIIPLTGNIIKERESRIAMRMKVMPVSRPILMSGKIIIYLALCLVQMVLMMLTGIYIMPLLGLPALTLGLNPWLLLPMTLAVSLAAIGFGIAVAEASSTHEQAASFGTVSVIILAALGGIWVPTFVMPEIMQKICAFSPMNWGLEGFYDILLRGSRFGDILYEISLLLLFFLATFLAGLWFTKRNT